MSTVNCYLHGSGESHGEQRRIKVTLDKAMIQALELLRLAKRCILDEVTMNSEEIKSVALVNIKLHLSEGISQSVS